MEKINSNFLNELFKLMFVDVSIVRMCSEHLSYSLIPKELGGLKAILKDVIEQFKETNKLPSIGVIAQKHNNNLLVQDCIKDIKSAQLADKELVTTQLEMYVREVEFQILNKKVFDLYNDGKVQESIELNAQESQRILSISLRNSGKKFTRIFRDVHETLSINKEESDRPIKRKIPFGIDKLDDLTYGGASPEDTVMWIMRSGVGKSTALRHHGLHAALQGHRVLHIQLEGGKRSVVDKYTQMWTNQTYRQVKKGELTEKEWKKVQKTVDEMDSFKRDIDVYSFDEFEEATVYDIRDLLVEYHKIYGYYPDLVAVDSLDLMMTGNKKIDSDPRLMKHRLQTCAQKIKNMAVEFNNVWITATQAGDVPREVWDAEDRVIDRSNTEGDRTLVKPFSFVFTNNVTTSEKKNDLARVYVDKLRDFRSEGEIIKIHTNFDKGKFYDRARSVLLEDEVSTLEKSSRRKKKDAGADQMSKI